MRPYHRLYVVIIVSIVVGGSLLAAVANTNAYHVYFAKEAYLDTTASHMPPRPRTILASKHNPLNVYFVKVAWLWTTLAFLVQALSLRSNPPARNFNAPPIDKGKKKQVDANGAPNGQVSTPAIEMIGSPLSQSVVRFVVATACWLVFSQWFFGASLSARVLSATGAQCIPGVLDGSTISVSTPLDPTFCETRVPITTDSHPDLFRTTSKVVLDSQHSFRARWQGGHDVSGHVFILTLSTLYLLEELSPYLPYLVGKGSRLQSFFPYSIWGSSNPFALPASTQRTVSIAALYGLVALVGLWLFMLAMTSLFFHTAFEKFTGLAIGLAAWTLLPKA